MEFDPTGEYLLNRVINIRRRGHKRKRNKDRYENYFDQLHSVRHEYPGEVFDTRELTRLPIEVQHHISKYVHGIPVVNNQYMGFVDQYGQLIHGSDLNPSNSHQFHQITRYHHGRPYYIVTHAPPPRHPFDPYHSYMIEEQILRNEGDPYTDEAKIITETSPSGVDKLIYDSYGHLTHVYRYEYDHTGKLYLQSHVDNMNRIETVYLPPDSNGNQRMKDQYSI